MIKDVNNTNNIQQIEEELSDDEYFFEYDEDIEEDILSYLQGWVVEKEPSTITEDDEEFVDAINNHQLDEEIMEDLGLQSTKTIKTNEVERYWNKTLRIVESYLQKTLEDITEDTHVILEGMAMWCAGLLWKKYNIRVIDQEDQTPTTGFGDNLIANAKNVLAPYTHFKCVLI